MRWQVGVACVIAVAVFALGWLIRPAEQEPVSFAMVQTQVEVPSGTMYSTTFGRLSEQRELALREVLTKGLADCWVAPPATLGRAVLDMRVRVQLDGSGRILSARAIAPDAPADSLQAIASIAAAERAVRDCQPYDIPEPAGDGLETVFVTIDFKPGGSLPPAQ